MGLRYSWKRILIVIKLLMWRREGRHREVSQVVLGAAFVLEPEIFICLVRGGRGRGV